MSLTELVIAMTILSMISVGAGMLLQGAVDIYEYGSGRSVGMYEAQRVLSRVRQDVFTTSHLFFPHGATPTSTALIIAAGTNQDNDSYANNSRFPRVDEDLSADMNNDGNSGDPSTSSLLGGLLSGLGSLLGNRNDDDGDGANNEDPWDGIDNDNDGVIDEDTGGDVNGDGYAGMRYVDENMNNQTDNTASDNDDEDGSTNEDWLESLVYSYDATNKRILRTVSGGSSTVVATGIGGFSVTYEGGTATAEPRLKVRVTVNNTGGTTSVLEEYMVVRNLKQRDARRVL